MNRYIVVWHPEAGMGGDCLHTSAHKVEGWSEDYAFFGHPYDLGLVTRLYPRKLVRSVELISAGRDNGITLQEAKRRANGISSCQNNCLAEDFCSECVSEPVNQDPKAEE